MGYPLQLPERSAPRHRTEPRTRSALDASIEGTLAASILTAPVSIVASGITFWASLLLAIFRSHRAVGSVLKLPPPIGRSALLFLLAAGASIALSRDPGQSASYLTKMARYLTIPLVYSFMSARTVWRVSAGLLGVLSASALYGVAQYFWLLDIDLTNRIHGFMGSWMTFSGQLMLGSIALFAVLLGGPRGVCEVARTRVRWLLRAVLVLLLFALLLTQTRSAWIGTALGIFLCTLLIRRRAPLVLALFALSAALLFAPASYRERLASGFDVQNPTTRDRIELVGIGLRMVSDHPWFGVGPGMVPSVAPSYSRGPTRPASLYCHLHNSTLNIAAEMGLAALAAWLAACALLLRDLYHLVRRGPFAGQAGALALAALCGLTGFLASGLFEHNFGDTEVLVPLLFLVTAPYAARFDGGGRELGPLASEDSSADRSAKLLRWPEFGEPTTGCLGGATGTSDPPGS